MKARGRRRHVIDYSRLVCVKCGRQFHLRPDQATPCPFIFSPRWLGFHRQGEARIRREVARLRRRGLLEDNQVANITRGHARPWPEARDNREIRRVLGLIERQQWEAIAGPRAAAPPSTVRYEDVARLGKAIAPQYKETIRIVYHDPFGEPRELEIAGHRLERIMGDPYWWRESVLLKPKPPIVQS